MIINTQETSKKQWSIAHWLSYRGREQVSHREAVEKRSYKRHAEERRHKSSAREGRKVAETLCSANVWPPEGGKVGSLKRRVQSHLVG